MCADDETSFPHVFSVCAAILRCANVRTRAHELQWRATMMDHGRRVGDVAVVAYVSWDLYRGTARTAGFEHWVWTSLHLISSFFTQVIITCTMR